MNNKSIDTYRHRIATAALNRHHRKTESNCIIVNTPNGGMKTIELTVEFMEQLLRRFEMITRGEFGNTGGDNFIQDAYLGALDINRNGERLTDSGKLIIDELIAEVIGYVKENDIGEDSK